MLKAEKDHLFINDESNRKLEYLPKNETESTSFGSELEVKVGDGPAMRVEVGRQRGDVPHVRVIDVGLEV